MEKDSQSPQPIVATSGNLNPWWGRIVWAEQSLPFCDDLHYMSRGQTKAQISVYERLYVLRSSPVLPNSYVRFYGRWYVLPNLYGHSYVHLYVLPNWYVHFLQQLQALSYYCSPPLKVFKSPSKGGPLLSFTLL